MGNLIAGIVMTSMTSIAIETAVAPVCYNLLCIKPDNHDIRIPWNPYNIIVVIWLELISIT